jgi:long-chain fatty acid transport protein
MPAMGENMGNLGYVRLACVSTAALLSGLGVLQEANAGGFAVREQSSQFQGTSWAGNAAGGALSSMFWNSAATATLDGTNSESVATIAIGDSQLHATSGLAVTGATPAQFPPAGVKALAPDSGNIGNEAFIPASYFNYQVNERLYLGLAMNSPFGFTTKASDVDWAGSPLGRTSKVFSIDINPTIAYKLTPDLTIGVGAQVEYIKVRLNSSPLPTLVPGANILSGRETKGEDWSVGATAGLIWQPKPGTTIGLGYRSPVEVDADVTCKGSGFTTFQAQGGSIPASLARCDAAGSAAHTKFTLPETVTLSARQDLSARLALLGTIEWTHHNRLQTVMIYNDTTGNAVDEIPLNFNDGWLYSLGAEYKYSPALTLRTGVAYERSPVSDDHRFVFLPDTDRIWASGGATYKWSDRLSIDLAYSHVFFEDNAKLTTLKSASLGTVLAGYSNTSADIVSTAIKYKVGGPVVPLDPYK